MKTEERGKQEEEVETEERRKEETGICTSVPRDLGAPTPTGSTRSDQANQRDRRGSVQRGPARSESSGLVVNIKHTSK